MGADIKSLRTRIKSVDSTLHLTKAMGLVASSKIRKAGIAMQQSRSYADAFASAMQQLMASPECAKSPYLAKRETNRTKLVVIAGDRGLAGGYNANIFRLLQQYPDAEVIPIGKRVCDRYGKPTVSSERLATADALQMAKDLCVSFAAGEYDRLGIISTKYVSMMTQDAQIQWVLPLERSESADRAVITYEPDEQTIINAAVPSYVGGVLIAALRESFACEVTARRMAMDSAGKNAQQMIDDLKLLYNRARQGAITQEITEIVAGSGS